MKVNTHGGLLPLEAQDTVMQEGAQTTTNEKVSKTPNLPCKGSYPLTEATP